ncbi:MAG: 30S ribosomal protein S20 [Dehalococcoidales bacterium]|nr:30S ribosomal protein S20 [Dehalococcoidales bacterium]MDD4229796.1 30S ribosomal protein S20 [Dehalococcoidales bacterium]MDD4465206.1 30S ribosomal protein S20 [Dehalococcoidales bacterium]MDD5402109.1 30S ribosomal protein S20 [Dehalococcoidales bacterium]
MANTSSAKKKIRADEAKRVRNKTVRSKTRTLITQARKAVEAEPAQAPDKVAAAMSALDRAAVKGIIHPNNAARRKSRLEQKLNKAQA